MVTIETGFSRTGTAESLELELTFELHAGLRRWGDARDPRDLSYLDELSLFRASPDASLSDCQELLGATETWVDLALDMEEVEHSSGAAVKRLQYGSPFQIELLLPLLTPAGLAGLFYAARRLYGINMDFKAYREQRRVEYLEAKKLADELERDIAQPALDQPKRWKLTGGVLREPHD
jgi:hypothetical protein